MASDLEAAGRYLNRDNLAKLAAKNNAWQQIQTDVNAMEEVLGITLQPETDEQKEHQSLSSQLLAAEPPSYSELITRTAVCRKSLG
jgi:phosphoenolpyruvate carboxylase